MIEGVIEWSIRNRLLVIAAACVLAVAGGLAMRSVPVDAIPDLSENQVIVFTDWPGRSPQEIEDQVTYPLTVNLQGLAGVKVTRSSSEFNFSMITIIFEDDVDFYFARQRVLERLSVASTFLPEGVVPYLAPDATALGQIFWYTVEGDGYDLGELRAIQDWYVRYQLNSVPGVAEAATVGGAPREYQVDLDPNTLRAYNVTLGEIYDAVTRANSAVGGRVVHKGNAEYLIRSVGWIRDLNDLRQTVVAQRDGVPLTLGTVATVQMGPGYKRAVLEKDGEEVVGGVVLMRHNENPREVTRRVKEKIAALRSGLPEGVRIVPFYDRTPLIDAAVANLEHVVIEETIICSLAILLILGHLGSALAVTIALPMAILTSFALIRVFGMTSNIMSLAGIAISVGILIDQAVVMVENSAHHLTKRFGAEPIRGDIRDIVIPACRTVGRPIFLSVVITILSFLPVFALSGLEGKMFHPLAYAKTFALVGAAILSITLVPALIPTLLKGRIKSERDSWIIRSMIKVYQPMLSWFLDRPGVAVWLFAVILGLGLTASSKLGREFMPRLNEGIMLEMPVSVPRMSVTQAAQDLKVRDRILRSFPEVSLVVGKAGRAETATDPSPLDMIETMINLRPHEQWPKRLIRPGDAQDAAEFALDLLIRQGSIKSNAISQTDRAAWVHEAGYAIADQINAELREAASARIATTEETRLLNFALFDQAIASAAKLGQEEALKLARTAKILTSDPDAAALGKMRDEAAKTLGRSLLLWRTTQAKLEEEMNDALKMPGWGNIFTQPIINRIDMLSSGVRTQVGAKIFGDDLDEIQKVSQQVADVVKTVRGAADVVPDQIVGKGYIEIRVEHEKAARYGIQVGDIQDVVEIAIGGKPLTTTVDGRRRYPIRIRYARDFRADEESLKRLLVAARGSLTPDAAIPAQLPLAEVAEIKVVEGPSQIKSENGLLRSYVQLNVRGRDAVGFVEEARRVVEEQVKLPSGLYIEWAGEFEHQLRAKNTLRVVFPATLAVIALLLYLAHRSVAETALVMTSVLGALAGGAMLQWILGVNFSVAVQVGYIACFGMAVETAVVMMVYLREAIEERGGLAAIGSTDELRAAVLEGAVHRLRPKLLTEGVAILSLAPMVFASGVGSEMIRPMAAPVLGGLLIADEVIDIFLPTLYFRLQRARWRRMRGLRFYDPREA